MKNWVDESVFLLAIISFSHVQLKELGEHNTKLESQYKRVQGRLENLQVTPHHALLRLTGLWTQIRCMIVNAVMYGIPSMLIPVLENESVIHSQ